jgi:SNF2 family DNA or RNA helicase
MIKISLHNAEYVKVDFAYNKQIVETLQTLPSSQYVDTKKSGQFWKVLLLDLPMLRDALIPFINSGTKVTWDSEVKEAYNAKIEFFKSIKLITDKTDSDIKLTGLKKGVKLYNFQKVAVEFLVTAERGLAALDMGLGKTITSIAATLRLIKDKKVNKVLIICPSSLKYNWALEIAKFTDETYLVVTGDAKKRATQYKNSARFIIMNYDLLRLDIKHIQKEKWDLVIADEIQRAKNYSTATSQTIREIESKYVFALTGTPIENDVMDLFTIMRFISPEIFGGNPKRFKDRYCNQNYFGAVTSYKNLDEIKKKLSNVMIRRKKRDVLDELPEITTNYYYVSLNDEEKRIYKQLKNGLLEDYRSGKLKHVDVLAKVVYLREACDSINLLAPGEKIVSSKLEELKKILSDLPTDAKVVIFTAFERMSEILQKNLPYKSVRLHGGVENGCKWERDLESDFNKQNKNMSTSELEIAVNEEKKKAICLNCPYYKDDSKCFTRKKMTEQFRNEKDIKLFISTDAGKEGLNLQAAEMVINFDMSFNPAVNNQRIARIDRIGQKSDKITVVNMVCYDTIEIRVLDILSRKQAIFDDVVDGKVSDHDILKKMSSDKIIEMI